jgi:hypothetical protein
MRTAAWGVLAVTLACGPARQPFYDRFECMLTVPQTGYGAGPMVARENHLYIAGGPGLVVWNTNNLLGFLAVGALALPQAPIGVAAFQSRAYVSDATGLTSVDLAKPEAPTVIGRLALPALQKNVLAGNATAAFVATADGKLLMLDTQGAAPTLVATVDGEGAVASLALVGDTLYALRGERAVLQAFAVSATGLTAQSELSLAQPAFGMAASTTHLYVDATESFVVLSLASPRAPAVVGTARGLPRPDTQPHQVVLAGDSVVIPALSADRKAGFWEVADPKLPVGPFGVGCNGPAHHLAFASGRVFASDGAGISISGLK